MRITILLCCLLFSSAKAQTPLRLKLTEIARGFTSPIGLFSPTDATDRLFVMEQGGKVKIIQNGIKIEKPFINISSQLDGLNIAYSEKGLLGMAFHPDYKKNGLFYLYYSAKTQLRGMDHESRISEFKVSANPNLADDKSERVLLTIPQPESNHNGGQMVFGADGFLYIGLGDGGGGGDQHGVSGNGQNLNTLLGKIIRIDVNTSKGYKIPSDNPFAKSETIQPEIWASGLRNPWRFSFDRATQKLFCADVGQNKYEEVNIIEKGKNYGWRLMEGNHCFDPPEGCDTKKYAAPIAEYDHSEGVSVIGGYVYRGREFPSLHGYYIFGDWNGVLFYLLQNEKTKLWDRGPIFTEKENNEINGKINSFGEDERGNIYIVTQKLFGPKSPTGVIYKIGY
ncbi:MAG: PQQ-dependent sugar dehydrogenase [Bacteroidetes bacterium]|nr:PQQ-dependent sugar dehydrogenase [Bacteroidota bacterium]